MEGMIDMLPVNVQKEMLLNHTRYLRFFRLRRERVKPGQNHPAQRMAESLPAVYKETLDLAFYQNLMMLLDPEKDVVSGLINREELEEKFHRLDRAVDADAGFKALGHMEREAAKLNGSELSAAALEGLGLGSIGIGSPETVILTLLMLRTLYETALLYGFNIDHPWEKDLALMLLSAAFSSGEDAYREQQALTRVLKGLADGVTPEIDREKRIRAAASHMAGSMSLQKFVQGIPVIGAAGLFFNSAAIKRLQTLSRCVYKQLYLQMKDRAMKAGHI